MMWVGSAWRSGIYTYGLRVDKSNMSRECLALVRVLLYGWVDPAIGRELVMARVGFGHYYVILGDEFSGVCWVWMSWMGGM